MRLSGTEAIGDPVSSSLAVSTISVLNSTCAPIAAFSKGGFIVQRDHTVNNAAKVISRLIGNLY